MMESSTYYTLEDYYALGEHGENKYIKWELIKGIFKMSLSPGDTHQKVNGALACEIWGRLRKEKKCQVRMAPYDVILGDSVVQPDISVICETDKISDLGCTGIPDLIVEVLSKSTVNVDRIDKFNLYVEFGLREYWIVDAWEKTVEKYVLTNGKLEMKRIYNYNDGGSITSEIFPDLEIELSDVFE